jgi:hypothetical protein
MNGCRPPASRSFGWLISCGSLFLISLSRNEGGPPIAALEAFRTLALKPNLSKVEGQKPENVVERKRRMEMGERIGIKGIDQIEPEMRIMSTIKSSQDMKWICNEGALAPRVR